MKVDAGVGVGLQTVFVNTDGGNETPVDVGIPERVGEGRRFRLNPLSLKNWVLQRAPM